jgi:hypothetical protein
MAWHEGAHVIAGFCSSRPADYVTIGGNQPHCAYTNAETERGERTLLALVVRSISGHIGGGIGDQRLICPEVAELVPLIEAARQGKRGSCDRCFEAMCMVAAFEGEADAEIAAKWRTLFRITLDLFDREEVRSNLRRLALAIEERTLLTRAEIEALIDIPELEAAWAEMGNSDAR